MTIIALNNSTWVSKFLDLVEGTFWSEESSIDCSTNIIFLSKPYPAGLRGSNLENWIDLQKRHLNPFDNGETHTFKGASNLYLWFSKNELQGIPETALQAPLSDGLHFVKGKNFIYRQRWKGKEMLKCETLSFLPEGEHFVSLDARQERGRAWAHQRKIDQLSVTPVFWTFVATVFFLMVFAYLGGAKVANIKTSSDLQSEEISIQEKLGDKLALQDRLQRAEAVKNGIEEWSKAKGSLTTSMAIVIDNVIEQTSWHVDAIDWQGHKLTVVLRTSELDIAELVASLERTHAFETVSIRPNTRAGTWNLEVTIKNA